MSTGTPNAISVFTFRSFEEIVATGGSAAWKLQPQKVGTFKYLLCCRSNIPAPGSIAEPETPGTAFLIGLISGVTVAPDDPDRWMVQISKYARIDVQNAWHKLSGWRNPVHYCDLNDLKELDLAAVEFLPMPEPKATVEAPRHLTGDKLTIAEAKRGLARNFGIDEASIEIIIRA